MPASFKPDGTQSFDGGHRPTFRATYWSAFWRINSKPTFWATLMPV
jgi:hypothetical protein